MILTHTISLDPKEKQTVFKLWNLESPKSLNYVKMEGR